MPHVARTGAKGDTFRSRRSPGFFAIILALGLLLSLAAAGSAEPLSRGRISVRARVLQAVGQNEIPDVLSQLRKEGRLRPSASWWSSAKQGEFAKLGERLVDHDLLRVGLLRGPEGYTLQIESLAN